MPYMFGNMMCRNTKRLASMLQQGDVVLALAHTGHNSGMSTELEVRAVHHWGVYAKLAKYPTSTRKDLADEWMKKNFKLKWKNIMQYYIK